MKLSLYRRTFESNVPYAIIFNDRLINSVSTDLITKHIFHSLISKGAYGTIINHDMLSWLELIDHYEFDNVNQLDQLLRDRNPELFL
jgi:hypothetical protein